MEETFSVSFQSSQELDASTRYQAIKADEVDVIEAFSTDALLCAGPSNKTPAGGELEALVTDAFSARKPSTFWNSTSGWTVY